MAKHGWAPQSVGEACPQNPEPPEISGMHVVFSVFEGKTIKYRCFAPGELKAGWLIIPVVWRLRNLPELQVLEPNSQKIGMASHPKRQF